jgi:hypothetical protein
VAADDGGLKMLRDNIPAITAVQGLRDQLKPELDQNEDFRAWQLSSVLCVNWRLATIEQSPFAAVLW